MEFRRVHFSFIQGGVCFVHLRDQHFTVQATIAKGENIPACMVKFVGKVNKESIVDVEATVTKPNNATGKVDLATQEDIELIPSTFFVVSRASQTPVVMEDLETPQPILDAQEAEIAEIEKKMEPLWQEKREIEEKEQIGKKLVAGAVKDMNSARAAVEKQKKDIAALREQLKAAEEAMKGLEETVEEKVKGVQETKEKVKEDAALYKQTPEEKARLKGIAAELKPLEEEKKAATKARMVGLSHRLDNRIIDLRTVANQAIFRIQSGVCTLFREILLKRNFVEIHSPKLIGTASEGGAGVFELGYFETKAYLAQSPQLYKQMAVTADLQKVFEVGPVFRAENSNTHRHLTEFIGLDMEMMFKEHYHEVLDQLEEMYLYIFDGLNERYRSEIEAVRRQFPFEDLKYTSPSLRLQWPDIIKLLRESGEEIGDYDDVNTTQEKLLGRLVKEKHGVDFYVVDKFPLSIRPFYTMPDPENPLFSNSYDFFLRGEEICSGAQRIHDPELLIERANHHKVDLAKIQPYIDAFKYGAYPHAGGGVGLERVVMLFLGLGNIRRASLFPRDPHRLSP
uniref:aspartate--tRNA ligase n=1 Tax=Paramoeba aestuarina TaxID=180227 RepID=A0A7S4KU94_9EUKA